MASGAATANACVQNSIAGQFAGCVRVVWLRYVARSAGRYGSGHMSGRFAFRRECCRAVVTLGTVSGRWMAGI